MLPDPLDLVMDFTKLLGVTLTVLMLARPAGGKGLRTVPTRQEDVALDLYVVGVLGA